MPLTWRSWIAWGGWWRPIARSGRCAGCATPVSYTHLAPVKMMMPTGALILPAMLLLVLGPVLLELANGF